MKWQIWVSEEGKIVLENVDTISSNRTGWTLHEEFKAEDYEKAKAFRDEWQKTYDFLLS